MILGQNSLEMREALERIEAGLSVQHIIVHKFGRNGAVPTTGATIMLPSVAFPYSPNDAPFLARIAAGGNAADTAAGTGARTVILSGLDWNFRLAREVLTTNGASASTASTTRWQRIFRVAVDETGSGGANAAAITIEKSTGEDLAQIPAGQGSSQLAFITIPRGWRGYMTHILAETAVVAATATVSIQGWERRNVDDGTTRAKKVFVELSSLSRELGSVERDFEYPLKFTEMQDIWFTASTTVGTAPASVAFTLLLEKDP